ncbi:NADH-cytochrome b5 reductase-like protein [Smittium culicis]|uniref:NADH-cytochrome b5 reductase n=1 Tax=Smittium culicis TaxID=133412 RepID=A0A1R1Y8N4_9FUNG|nr:NADH-cytochrome b5 reductase-like protein [Smittium culicis]OMJ23311.1 NADH-cytochrome b5 reductase-like protein [Smittium culicis]
MFHTVRNSLKFSSRSKALSSLYLSSGFKSFQAFKYSTAEQNKINSALKPDEFIPFQLIKAEKINHNTKLYRFKIDDDSVSGMVVASSLVTKVPDYNGAGIDLIRPYTPTSLETTKGELDLVVKVYPEGKMSKHIDSLKVGDSLLMRGPIVKYKYEANKFKEIGMIAGGTGITPMLQIIRKVLHNPEDKTELKLLFANTGIEDILLKEELDKLAADHGDQFKVSYIISSLDNRTTWDGHFGYITKDIIEKFIPIPKNVPESITYVCGPPGMMNVICLPKVGRNDQGPTGGFLGELGFTPSHVFKF